jgi:hypothetical protein
VFDRKIKLLYIITRSYIVSRVTSIILRFTMPSRPSLTTNKLGRVQITVFTIISKGTGGLRRDSSKQAYTITRDTVGRLTRDTEAKEINDSTKNKASEALYVYKRKFNGAYYKYLFVFTW